jgi:hypothetical protein
MTWVNQHADDCPVTKGRAAFLRHRALIVLSHGEDVAAGMEREYNKGGDQESDLCACHVLSYERGRLDMRDDVLEFLHEASARLALEGRSRLSDRYLKTAEVIKREFPA